MPKFIGEVGVKRLWNKISEQFVQKEVGKGLSENNFSDEYKTELDNLISGTTENEVIERLKYYDDKDIIPSDSSYFTVNSTGETITGLTDTGKTQTELVIPYEINGKKITTLCSGSDGNSGPPVSILNGNSTITKVVIPKSVTTLGGAAFYGCSSLASINIPNGVTSIENYAFMMCSSLTSVNIPNSITSIGNSAFVGCSSLKSIDIPNSVTSIGDDAFTACSALTSVKIPNSVTSIGDDAFGGRDPATLTIYCEQGSYAETFAKGKNISVVYTTINENDLINKDDLSNKVDKLDRDNGITIGSDVGHILGLHIKSSEIYEDSEERFKLSKDGLVINYNASGYAPNTADVIVNRNVESAEGTYNVVSHKLTEKANTSDVLLKTNTTEFTPTTDYQPATKKYVDDAISSGGSSIVIDSELSDTSTNAVQNKVIKQAIDLKAEQVELERLKYYGDKDIIPAPESYFTVSGNTLTGLTDTGKMNLSSDVVIPYKINGTLITSIGTGAFKNYEYLIDSITLPSSITAIEAEAFYGCTFGSIEIPSSVLSIGDSAFANCSALTSVTILNHNNILLDYSNIFSGCNSTLKIYCEQGSPAETFAKNNNIPVVYLSVKGKVTTITVPTTGWTTSTDTNGTTYYTRNITDSILTSAGYPITDVVLPSDIAAARLQSEAYQNINKITVNDGSVTLYCFDSLPTVSFQIRIQIMYF